MKVYIGPYKDWVGPYQLAERALFWLPKDNAVVDRFGEWLSNTPVNSLCNWIDKRRRRKTKIRIHEYDTWSMDDTLATIVLPMLQQLQATKHGSPHVQDEDVPEHLQSTNAPAKLEPWDIDANHHARWDWVIAEMIWAFEQLQPDYDWEKQYYTGHSDIQFTTTDGGQTHEMTRGPLDTFCIDREGMAAHDQRIDRGLQLFGKYYRGLWD